VDVAGPQLRRQTVPLAVEQQQRAPPSEPEGRELRAALLAQGIPLFAVDIPRLKAFEKAAAAGVPVYGVKDVRAIRGWEAYEAVGKELFNGQ
jgi:chromosome partitioning protein